MVVAVTMGTSSRDISPNGTHEPTQQLAIISLFATRYKVGPLALGKSDWSRLCCLVVRSSSSSQLFNSQRSRLSPSLVVPTQRTYHYMQHATSRSGHEDMMRLSWLIPVLVVIMVLVPVLIDQKNGRGRGQTVDSKARIEDTSRSDKVWVT